MQPPFKSLIDDSVAALQRGGVIAYPTETVYGLGGDPALPKVAVRLEALKGRGSGKTFLALIPNAGFVDALTHEIPALAQRLIDVFWPGALTLLLPAGLHCPGALRSQDGFVGLRVSPDPLCSALVNAWGKPLISTSANLAGEAPAQTAERVRSVFGTALDHVLDGGPRVQQAPSTLVRISGDQYEILREGAITRDQIDRQLSSH